MTKRQQGQVFKLGDGTWAYRYRSSDGKRPQHGGYKRQGDARQAAVSA